MQKISKLMLQPLVGYVETTALFVLDINLHNLTFLYYFNM